ncbi:MAG TPA: S53 family peptidase [Acidimicrobiales bacterium]
MILRRFSRAAVVGAAAFVLLGTATAAVASTKTVVTPARKQVPVALPGLSTATHLGDANPEDVRTIGVGVARPDPTGEQQLYDQLYDPASPNYHQFLTTDQFNSRFAVPATTQQAVLGFLQGGGLSVATTSAAGDYVTATGTVSQLDRLFNVHIGNYRIQNFDFVANDVAPSVPVALPITAVVGLDTVHQFHLPSTLSTPRPLTTDASGTSFSGTLLPQDLWNIYDEPASNLGQGQTVGMFAEGASDSTITNLRLFEQHFSFPKVPVRVVRTEPGTDDQYGDELGNVEWYLDTQAETGMAPDVSRLDMYMAKSLFDADIFQDFKSWADDPKGPAQMNASFGECEQNPANPLTGPLAQVPYGTEFGDELQPIGDPILRQATLEGRTLFSSTGDTGSGCPEVVVPLLGAGNGVAIQPVPTVSYPAASPYAVGVGGTVITTDGTDHGQRTNEVSWTFTGGGSSNWIAEPGFQKFTPQVSHQCIAKPDGTPYAYGTTCRGIPDVSSLSGNVNLTGESNGYFIYWDGNPSAEGGTSLSSPLWAGMWTRIQAASRTNLGFADEALYRAARSGHPDFYDVTASETPAGNGAYQPAAGWDYTSGLGTPDVAKLMDDIAGHEAARLGVPAPEKAPAAVSSVHLTGVPGNANDPVDVQLGNVPASDITDATLAASPDGKSLVATVSGPALSASPPPDSLAGRDFYVLWSYKGTEYFAHAHIDPNLGNAFESGDTTTGSYTATPNTQATGSFTGNTVTITVPRTEVGSPAKGAQLLYPFAISQMDAGAGVYLALTADTVAASPSATPSVGVSLKLPN